MRIIRVTLLLLFISGNLVAAGITGFKDSAKRNTPKFDTTFIETFRQRLILKVAVIERFNTFSITDQATKRKLEYSINSSTNIGIGVSYKGIGIELQVAPKFLGNNSDDYKYGKTSQFSLSTSANSRRFIYDVYVRANQGFHTTEGFDEPGDTINKPIFLYRPDIYNFNLGAEVVYIFNNKHFSSSSPYNFTQRQKRGAGSALFGTLFSIYTVSADSAIFPDSLKSHFAPEVQFKEAGSLTWGVSFGYTYTFVFGRKKSWFANLYTLPGLAVQQYYATNVYSQQTKSRVALGIPFQLRLSLGYNRPNYFWGFAFMGNNYQVNTDRRANFSYQFGSVRVYYGYRFKLKKEYFSKYLK